MDSTQTIALGLLILFGLVAGYFTSQSSNKRETIYGGTIAKLFNYLAACLMVTLTPTVLTLVIVLRTGILPALAVAISMVILANILLIFFAIAEKPAKEARAKLLADRGWTAEDAISSGL